jgi:hypothetical protein
MDALNDPTNMGNASDEPNTSDEPDTSDSPSASDEANTSGSTSSGSSSGSGGEPDLPCLGSAARAGDDSDSSASGTGDARTPRAARREGLPTLAALPRLVAPTAALWVPPHRRPGWEARGRSRNLRMVEVPKPDPHIPRAPGLRAAAGPKFAQKPWRSAEQAARPREAPRATRAIGATEERHKIDAALAEAAACRRPGATGGIYGLANLAPFRRLSGALVIRHAGPAGGGFGARPWFSRATSDAEFRRRLRCVAPFLENFELEAHGFYCAGAPMSAVLMRPAGALETLRGALGPFTLVPVGHATESSAMHAVRVLAEHLHGQWGRMVVYRSPLGLAFGAERAEPGRGRDQVQVVLRLCATPGEIAHGFSAGSDAVLWDGSRVLLTGLGRLAAEHGANVLDLSVRGTDYERRLADRFAGGFDLVLPKLNPVALVARKGCLPFLRAEGLRVRAPSRGGPERLVARRLRPARPEDFGVRPPPIGSPGASKRAGAGLAGAANLGAPDPLALALRNIRALAEGRPESLCASAGYHAGCDVFAVEPLVDERLVRALAGWCFGPSGANAGMLGFLLGPFRAARLLELPAANGAPDAEALARLSAERAAELNLAASIPVAFSRAGSPVPRGLQPRGALTEEEWYGAALEVE